MSTNLSVQDVSLAGDFDGKTAGGTGSDAFYTTLLPNGLHQWWYFYDHTNPPAIGSARLAYDGTSPDQLRFGDFNGDGVTDVFRLAQRCTVYAPVVLR